MPLSSALFRSVTSKQNDTDRTKILEVYQCLKTTAVLYSKSAGNPPLAALSFESHARRAKTLITKREDAASRLEAKEGRSLFHALTSVDGAEYSLHITNLTEAAMMKIDILAENVPVTTVNLPTVGINEVNELRASSSYEVESDQRAGHTTLVLQGLQTASHAPMDVEMDEAGGIHAPTRKGTYWFVQVTPPANDRELCSLFSAGTYWAPAEMICRQVVATPPNFTWGAGLARGDSDQPFPMGRAPSQFEMAGARSNHNAATWGVKSDSCRGRGTDHDTESRTRGGHVDATASQVQSAQAGVSVAGSHRVKVESFESGIKYAYETPSERMVLGMAVWRDMPLFDDLSHTEALSEAQLMLSEVVNKAMTTGVRVFDCGEDCTVCASALSTLVVLRCGHRCLCQNCHEILLQRNEAGKCVICRARVVGVVAQQALPY